jgi:hypothetical protein
VHGPDGDQCEVQGFHVNVLTGSAVCRTPASTVMHICPDLPTVVAKMSSESVISEATKTISHSNIVRWYYKSEAEILEDLDRA